MIYLLAEIVTPVASVILFIVVWRLVMLDRPEVVGACVLVGVAVAVKCVDVGFNPDCSG